MDKVSHAEKKKSSFFCIFFLSVKKSRGRLGEGADTEPPGNRREVNPAALLNGQTFLEHSHDLLDKFLGKLLVKPGYGF